MRIDSTRAIDLAARAELAFRAELGTILYAFAQTDSERDEVAREFARAMQAVCAARLAQPPATSEVA
jgi:hypothetical protein